MATTRRRSSSRASPARWARWTSWNSGPPSTMEKSSGFEWAISVDTEGLPCRAVRRLDVGAIGLHERLARRRLPHGLDLLQQRGAEVRILDLPGQPREGLEQADVNGGVAGGGLADLVEGRLDRASGAQRRPQEPDRAARTQRGAGRIVELRQLADGVAQPVDARESGERVVDRRAQGALGEAELDVLLERAVRPEPDRPVDGRRELPGPRRRQDVGERRALQQELPR